MTGLDSTIASNSNEKPKKRTQSFKSRIENSLKIQFIEVKDKHPVVAFISSNSIEHEADSSSTSENSNTIGTKTDEILKKHHQCQNVYYTFNNLKKQAVECSKRLSSISIRNHKSKSRSRLINKNGESNLNRVNIPSRSRKYIADLFTTLIDMKWGFVLLIFILSYLISWLLFAFCWHLIQVFATNCVTNLNTSNIISSILFSIETQQTIGYGSRHLNDSCESGTLLVMIQSCFSVLLQSFMGGIVFAKLSIPKKRTETLIFSKSAVISLRDGQYCLMCRVGDIRKSHITQASVSMYILKTRYTKEGEVIPQNVQELNIDHNANRLLLCPVIVEHRIDFKSPLYDLLVKKSNYSTKSENLNEACVYDGFKSEDFEIIVILEGVVESTGATTQARTSYLPNEILWNSVYTPLFNLSKDKPTIDFSKFDEVIPMRSIPDEINNQNTVTSNLSFYSNVEKV